MQSVIMAGGKGTRLSSITNDEIPKPMAQILGKPILEHQIQVLKANGISEFIIVVGYKREKIMEYFSDGSRFGINIKYIVEEEPLGTAGAFFFLKEHVENDFILVYGDIIFDIDVKRMHRYHQTKKAQITLLVHPNSHPYDSDLVIMNSDDRVTAFDSKNNIRGIYDNCVNAGIYIMSSSVLNEFHEAKKTDLEKDFLAGLIASEAPLYGYHSTEYVKDVGTPERLVSAEKDMRKNIIACRNLSKKQKCIFVDRDGTVNVNKGLLYRVGDLELEVRAAQAIKEINRSSYLCIVITNQPVIARNLCTVEELGNIHKKLQTLLGNAGAYVDELYYCPHHPHKGYEGENPFYKIECDCRKPKTGLIQAAVEMYNIDLSASWFVGDTTVDIQAGINAGTQTILVHTGEAGNDGKYQVKANFECADLYDAVKYILRVDEND